jgi:hypothetical protein
VTARARRPLSVVAVFGIAVMLAPAGAQEKKEPAKPAAAKGTLADKLARKVTLDKTDGKFGDVVRDFAEKFDLPLVVDRFTSETDEEILPVETAKVRLPKLVNVRVDTALCILCDQVKGMPLVRADHVRIVPAAVGLYESGVLKQPDPTSGQEEDAPLLPQVEMQKAKPLIHRALVTAAYRKVTLEDVLDDVAEATGANVVLSPEVGPKANVAVTARFANTPVDAAVRTLCEMTDLGVIEDANVLVVTTRERAAARAKADEEKRLKARVVAIGPVGIGGSGLGGGVVVPAELVAELSKLKEQNEKLQKEVEELKKGLKK